MADGRRGPPQLGELSPAVASLAVSVITVTVLLAVIAHGASAEPLARRYGAAAGPGGNGDHGLLRAGLPAHLSFPEIAGEMFLSRTMIKSQALSIYRKLGACSRSQAVTRSGELGLLQG
jgi:DNA-binding CsgD family transcriptional regulator